MAEFPEIAARLRGWPRRILALACLLVAAASALTTRSSADAKPGPSAPVLVAAHALAAGTVLRTADLQIASWPTALRKASGLARAEQAVGHRLAAGVAAHEAVTTTRLVGRQLATGLPPGLVATTVPLAGSAATSLVHAGDLVDLLATIQPPVDGGPASAEVLAHDARVLAVLPAPTGSASGEASTTVVVAVDSPTARRIAAASGLPILATVRDPP